MTSPYFTLTHQRGFGTFPLSENELDRAVEKAVAVGYRAFDTAQIYGNEADVGRALASLGLPRSELFITTKVQHDNLTADRFIQSVERSLADLKVDRVDVLLLHFPPLEGPLEPGLELLIEAKTRGLTEYIGVSNYDPGMMRRARQFAGDDTLVINQVEFHPLLDGSALLAASVDTGIPLAAYCTVARGEVLKYPLLASIGAGRGKSASQIALRWTLQQGVAVNTMSTKPDNIRSNFDIMDFVLSSPEMAQINTLCKTKHRIITKQGGVPWAPDWD